MNKQINNLQTYYDEIEEICALNKFVILENEVKILYAKFQLTKKNKPINNVPVVDAFELPDSEFKSGTWVPTNLKASDTENEILDISLYKSIEDAGEVSRALLAFSNTEISDLLTNKIALSNYKAYLKLYLANASEIPTEYKIECHPVSGTWDMGTGRLANFPATQNGVSWNYKTLTNTWTTAGGDWITGSVATQSFTYNDEKDIELNVTTAVAAFFALRDALSKSFGRTLRCNLLFHCIS